MGISGMGGMGGDPGGNGPEDDKDDNEEEERHTADGIWGDIPTDPGTWNEENFTDAINALDNLIEERAKVTDQERQEIFDEKIIDVKDWIRDYCDRTGKEVPEIAQEDEGEES